MHAIVGFLFLLPHVVCAMEAQTDVQKIKTVRDSVSLVASGNNSSRNASSLHRTGLCNALALELEAENGPQAPRNSKVTPNHKRTVSVPLPAYAGTPIVPPLSFAQLKLLTSSSSSCSSAASEKEQEEMASFPGVPQAAAAALLVPSYISPEWESFNACIVHLYEVMRIHTKPRSVFYDLQNKANDKKAYFRPYLKATAEPYYPKIGAFKQVLPRAIDALLESLYPSHPNDLKTNSVSSVATPTNRADKKEHVASIPAPAPNSCCVIL